MLIGGEPLEEDIVMWWNSWAGRMRKSRYGDSGTRPKWALRPAGEHSPLHDQQLDEPISGPLLDELVPTRYPDNTLFPQYGEFPPNQPAPLPAPELPNVAMKPRQNPPTVARRKDPEDA